ncbi:hypothetical protein A1332_15010 [Methylomonas methanica]|uniref:Uncharacterized protein n=1 Tax=Methylomonas methanica TaxID=421 RepID=A0A177MDJ5_METMH|nr:hypothetical protein A1332_15010 [Methylomonas methanica]
MQHLWAAIFASFFTLVPKLQFGNAILKAPAFVGLIGKLELPRPSNQVKTDAFHYVQLIHGLPCARQHIIISRRRRASGAAFPRWNVGTMKQRSHSAHGNE